MRNGGPAFPMLPFSTGMSLRDYFADSAMHSLRISPSTADQADANGMAYEAYVAEQAYLQADAMLAEQAKAIKPEKKEIPWLEP